MQYQNIMTTVSNYATSNLDEVLTQYGKVGFKLVNAVMAKNKYGSEVMYLFFTKEMVGEDK